MPSPRLSNFRLDQIWRQAQEPTFWLDKALRIVWVNPAWETLTGHSSSAVLGISCTPQSPTEAGDLHDLAASFHPPAATLLGHPSRTLALILHAGGDKFWRELDFWPYHDEKGELFGVLGRVHPQEPGLERTRKGRADRHDELLASRRALLHRHGLDTLIGLGLLHDRLLEQVRVAATISTPVLIVGEPGSGRRALARTIHQQGVVPQDSIVFLDSEAFPPELLDRQLLALSETGQAGKYEASSDSVVSQGLTSKPIATCVVGDIVRLPRDVQARFVSLLKRREKPRFLAITSSEPEVALQKELIRPDLFYELTSLVLRIPPLRERRSELMLFAQFFLERANRRGGQQKSGFKPSAEAVLAGYDWPGNLRELERVINHAREQAKGILIAADDLPASIQGNVGAAYTPPSLASSLKPLDELLTEIERQLIEHAYQKARRNKSKAAEYLGISRPRLYRRMKELNLLEESDLDEDTNSSSPASG